MPELPEVETTRRGIESHILHQVIIDIELRNLHLRWPILPNIKKQLIGNRINSISRRGKYLLFHFEKGSLIIHLGMSGILRLLPPATHYAKHDHVDVVFDKMILRFTDPRRFGAFFWAEGNGLNHPLLKNLGAEPLEQTLTGTYLYQKSLKRKMPIKSFIMDAKVVVGVGNIYANEALFLAGIHPLQASNSLDLEDFKRLVQAIKQVLRKAIAKGGTTLKDFMGSDGKPGYFSQHLNVYGREGLACTRCKTPLTAIRVGQRSTFFCAHCQPYK